MSASGVLVIDKARGPTSHDVVAHVRHSLGLRRIGHAGTLDPMASGVLVLAVGEATKLVPWLVAEDKAYEATIALGVETDTLDAAGQEVRRAPIGSALRAALSSAGGGSLAPELRAALEAESERKTQVPPAFSAVKQNGERCYVQARRGLRPVLGPRSVRVRSLELRACSSEPPHIAVGLIVGKGYYVRAFARDLATALGTVGHLISLRRTRSGSFAEQEALPMDRSPDELRASIHPLPQAAGRVLPVAELTDAGVRDARRGVRVGPADLASETRTTSAWFDGHGHLVAVGEVDDAGYGRVVRGFT
jgi:tRNA pseudouridine55 synthase